MVSYFLARDRRGSVVKCYKLLAQSEHNLTFPFVFILRYMDLFTDTKYVYCI